MAHWDRRELNKLVAENPDEYKKRFPEPFSAMIPEDASSENKLATEAYVDEHGGGSIRDVDSYPVQGSNNLITSGGVYDAIIGVIDSNY